MVMNKEEAKQRVAELVARFQSLTVEQRRHLASRPLVGRATPSPGASAAYPASILSPSVPS